MSPFLLAAAVGLVIGSFLNVCIYRLPRRQSVVWPASRCPSCHRALVWYENIPVLSYLALRGACRTCHARISPVYPLVELLTAVVFVATLAQVGVGLLLAVRLVFACAMIVLAFIDLRHRILPNAITVPGIVAGIVASAVVPPGWLASLIGILAGGGILLLIAWIYERVRHQEGLGMGDVKMLAMIGAFLGWKLMLLTLVLSSLLGSVVGLLVILAAKGDMKHALPFGTFLAAGALVASLTGDAIITWYLGFY
ncbi:MAG: prepilin peptidase [Acidobacteria bacterium]|nr:prepilin peptidase [Acidobacteriota bacterium]